MYFERKEDILLIILRYASCFHSVFVRFWVRAVILFLYADIAFSIMLSVSMPLARPVMTFRFP